MCSTEISHYDTWYKPYSFDHIILFYPEIGVGVFVISVEYGQVSLLGLLIVMYGVFMLILLHLIIWYFLVRYDASITD